MFYRWSLDHLQVKVIMLSLIFIWILIFIERGLTLRGVIILMQIMNLNIHFSTQQKFDKQVSAIVRNANYRLSSSKRSFGKFNLRNFLLFYKSLVLPLLEYNTSIWLPLNVMDEFHIEKIQRRMSRMIPYLQHLSNSSW